MRAEMGRSVGLDRLGGRMDRQVVVVVCVGEREQCVYIYMVV